MQNFKLLFRLTPTGYFGLPDGDRIVVPVREGREIIGPSLDVRSGHLVANGTQSEFRPEDGCASAVFSVKGLQAVLRDNFLELALVASDMQSAVSLGESYAASLARGLSVMHRERFSTEFLSVEGDAGNVHGPSPQSNPTLLRVTSYHIPELNDRFLQASEWAVSFDTRACKALFYFEHACLLNEFAQSLPFAGPHAAFSRALAFLQVYKALTSIIGDPSSDRDYQSRCKRLGLGKDFWSERAKPLYVVRNQSDVAHYSEFLPEPGAFLETYAQACIVFAEAFTGHMSMLKSRSDTS